MRRGEEKELRVDEDGDGGNDNKNDNVDRHNSNTPY